MYCWKIKICINNVGLYSIQILNKKLCVTGSLLNSINFCVITKIIMFLLPENVF